MRLFSILTHDLLVSPGLLFCEWMDVVFLVFGLLREQNNRGASCKGQRILLISGMFCFIQSISIITWSSCMVSFVWSVWSFFCLCDRCVMTSILFLIGLCCGQCGTHWGWDKMADIFQTTFSNAFSWMEMYECWLRFHWSLFLRFKLIILQHWFR